MATRHPPHIYDSTGLSSLTQNPSRISLASPLLAFEIPLPADAIIAYWVYKPLNISDSLQSLEAARNKLVRDNEAYSVGEALLSGVQVARDSASSALYVFAIRPSDVLSSTPSARSAMYLDGLACVETYQFSPKWLYPCSPTCSTQLDPCPACVHQDATGASSASWTSAYPLPREPLRRIYSRFIHALRDRLIDDISRVSSSSTFTIKPRRAVRYKRGFLLSTPQAVPGEWTTGWDYHARERPLVYCELRLYLQTTRVLVHPVLHAAHFIPLASAMPPAIGMPITLLPHGVPAYYLNTYTGPVGSLTSQFETAFCGLGVGEWKTLFLDPDTQGPRNETKHGSDAPPYAIAWLAVQNRHGEDKGVPVIWPTNLCTIPLYPRMPLNSIPALPAQLLASPPAPATKAPPIKLPLSSLSPAITLSEPESPDTRMCTERATSIDIDSSHTIPRLHRPPFIQRSLTSDSLRAFRSLTIDGTESSDVAGEVRMYVDAVAKEREKERERLKRERDGGNASRSVPGTSRHADRTPSSSSLSVISSPRKSHREEIAAKHELNGQNSFSLTEVGLSSAGGDLYGRSNGHFAAPDSLVPQASIVTPPESATMQAEIGDTKTISQPVVASQQAVMDTSTNSFDPFSAFDSNWNQTTNDFMGIGMPLDTFDLSFPMDINETRDGGNDGGTFSLDDGFGVFTDDDFNFFDGPSTTTRITAAPTSVITSAPLAVSLPSAAILGDAVHASGPGPPFMMPHMPQPGWLHQTLGETLTPRSLDAPTPTIPPPPDLLPATPTPTPPSNSTPATPSVVLADQLQFVHIRRSSISSTTSSNFDPIPFARSHRTADGKYALGKFALPNPPPGEAESSLQLAPSQPPSFKYISHGWQSTYSAATDPRIGIVRRLAGAKRKRVGVEIDGHEDRQSPLWAREYEEWTIDAVPEQLDSDGDEAKSASDTDGEVDPMEEEQSAPSMSPTHTPPPTFLPIGPLLIQTQFQHGLLLPLSVPLRPPNTDPGEVMAMNAPMSAPTPVSPAAILGTPSERSKALESAAQVLVREVVENLIWDDCWRASLAASLGARGRSSSDIWTADVRAANKLLAAVIGPELLLDIGKAFVADTMHELHPPSFTVAKAEGIMQVLPPAIRFWEKLGFHPRSGAKNITAYLFYEGSSDDNAKEKAMVDWLDRISKVYTSKNYGSHVCGRTAACTRDGIVPVGFESFRKTLVSFVATLVELDNPTVLYIVTPARTMNLASPLLRQILSAVKKVQKTFPDTPIFAHLIPESVIHDALHEPASYYGGLGIVVDAVYNRAPVLVERTISRQLCSSSANTRALFSDAAFVLAPTEQKKATFSLDAHPASLDVIDHHYALHIGYRISDCGKWLLAACIDQRGEIHNLKVWLISEDSPEHFVVTNVWNFLLSMAAKANIEWRVTITKLGLPNPAEIETWISRLDSASKEYQHLPPMQILLLVSEYEDSWTFITPDDASAQKTPLSPNRISKYSSSLVFADVSSATYILESKVSTIACASSDHFQEAAFVPDAEDDNNAFEVAIRPILSTTLVRVPAGADRVPICMLHINLLHSIRMSGSTSSSSDKEILDAVTRNFFELAVLTRCRWNLNANPILPFHLAALEVMSYALCRGDAVVE